MGDLVQLAYQAAAGLYSGFAINAASRHYTHKYSNWVEAPFAGNWTAPTKPEPVIVRIDISTAHQSASSELEPVIVTIDTPTEHQPASSGQVVATDDAPTEHQPAVIDAATFAPTETSIATPFVTTQPTTAPTAWARFLAACYAAWLSIWTTLNLAWLLFKINVYWYLEKIAESANDAITYVRTSCASLMSWELFNPFGGHSVLALIVAHVGDSIAGLLNSCWNCAVAECAAITGYVSSVPSWFESTLWPDATDALKGKLDNIGNASYFTWWPRATGIAFNHTEAIMTKINNIGNTSYYIWWPITEQIVFNVTEALRVNLNATTALSIVNDIKNNAFRINECFGSCGADAITARDIAAASVFRLSNMNLNEVGLLTVALILVGLLASWLIGAQRFNAFVGHMRNTPFAHDLARVRNTVGGMFAAAIGYASQRLANFVNIVLRTFTATFEHASHRLEHLNNTLRWAYVVALWFWAHYRNQFFSQVRGIYATTGRFFARGYAAVRGVVQHPNLAYWVFTVAFIGVALGLRNRSIGSSWSNPPASVPSSSPSVSVSLFDLPASVCSLFSPDLTPSLSPVWNMLSSIPLPGLSWLLRAFAVAALVSVPVSFRIAGMQSEVPVDRRDIPILVALTAVADYWYIWDRTLTQLIADSYVGFAVGVALWHYPYPIWHTVVRRIQPDAWWQAFQATLLWHNIAAFVAPAGPIEPPASPDLNPIELAWAELPAGGAPFWTGIRRNAEPPTPADVDPIEPPNDESEYDTTNSESWGGSDGGPHGGSGHDGSGHGSSGHGGSDRRSSDDAGWSPKLVCSN
jgi:uncharacterized membrane protein YgcG